MPRFLAAPVLLASMLSACVDKDSLTGAEIERQNRADAFVAGVLFDHGLDDSASYNVHKDGFVVVRFAPSVAIDDYTRVVNIMRASPDLGGVRAEQGGREVCRLTGYR